jgi:deoxyribodipyrimidine photo-lyase
MDDASGSEKSIELYTGKEIPEPVVEIAIATKQSKDRLYARRNLSEVRAGKKSVVDKHASRAKRKECDSSKAKGGNTSPQFTFEF